MNLTAKLLKELPNYSVERLFEVLFNAHKLMLRATNRHNRRIYATVVKLCKDELLMRLGEIPRIKSEIVDAIASFEDDNLFKGSDK